jgi:hypothetical protein
MPLLRSFNPTTIHELQRFRADGAGVPKSQRSFIPHPRVGPRQTGIWTELAANTFNCEPREMRKQEITEIPFAYLAWFAVIYWNNTGNVFLFFTRNL